MPDSGTFKQEKRRATNVTLPEALVGLAKELGVNVSQACEAGLAAEVKAAGAKKWLEENREVFEAWHKYYEENEPTLTKYRTF